MKVNIHYVKSIEINPTQGFNSFVCKTIVIRDEKGNKYELTLFADDANKLKCSD